MSRWDLFWGDVLGFFQDAVQRISYEDKFWFFWFGFLIGVLILSSGRRR